MPGIKPMFKQGALGGECSNHSLPTIFFNDFAQSEKVGLFHAKKYPNIYPPRKRKFNRLFAVLVTIHFAGSWYRLSFAEPTKDPLAAASSGQFGISCNVLAGAKSAANSQLVNVVNLDCLM
jgi:hypothetical protein